MKELMMDRRRSLPALAALTALLLTFAVPPLSRVVAAGSSSSASSMSSFSGNCDSSTSLGSAAPGQTVSGDLGAGPGQCGFTGTVVVSLNGSSLSKVPDSNGNVHVSVQVTSTTKGVLDDPVDAALHCGTNTVTAEGTTNAGVDAVASGTFTVVCAGPPGPAGPAGPRGPTGIVGTIGTTGGGGLARTGLNIFALLILAAMAIALGVRTVASERAVPVAATVGLASQAVPTMAAPTMAVATMESPAGPAPMGSAPTFAAPTLSLGGRWRGAARVARQFSRR